MLKKASNYLSAVYKDTLFWIFFSILTIKTILFFCLVPFGFNAFVPTLGSLLTILSFSLLVRNVTYKFLYLLFVNISISLIFTTQSLYFEYFKDLFSFFNIHQAKQVTQIANSILTRLDFETFFLPDILILPFIYFKKREHFTQKNTNVISSFILIFLLGLYCNINFFKNISFANSMVSRCVFAYNFGIINYEMHDLKIFLSNKLNSKEMDSLKLSFLQQQLLPKYISKHPNNYTGIGKGYNVIAIQVESLQNFVIGKKINGQEITPNLNRLSRTAIVFQNIFDQTAAGNSSDAMFLSNCSLYPAANGTIAFLYSQNTFDSLAKVLSEQGYATMVLHAYYKDFWNFEALDKSLGFQHRHYQDDYLKKDIIGWGISDRSFFSQSLEKIEQIHAPFYVHMRTLTTHDPFDAVTGDIDGFPLHSMKNLIIGRYIRSMHYVDSAIGEFLQSLSVAGLLKKTVIIVYGDHRARLPKNELQLVGVFDENENRKVPLIISNTQWKTENSNDSIGGLIDLAPTVSNILGIDYSDKVFLGHDLAAPDAGYVIFRDGTFISQAEKMDQKSARKKLIASDLIIEKDCISLLKKHPQESKEQRFSANH